jgi:hypothetical protein
VLAVISVMSKSMLCLVEQLKDKDFSGRSQQNCVLVCSVSLGNSVFFMETECRSLSRVHSAIYCTAGHE